MAGDRAVFGEGFATLSDFLVGKQRLDPSLDTEAIVREMLRPVVAYATDLVRSRRAGRETPSAGSNLR